MSPAADITLAVGTTAPDPAPAPLRIDLPDAVTVDPDLLTIRVRHVIEWEIDVPVLLGRLLALGQLGDHADTLLDLARTHAGQRPARRRERGQRVELVSASVKPPSVPEKPTTRREDRRAAHTATAEQTDPPAAATPEPDHADWTSADWAAAAPAPLTTTGWDAAAHRALTTPAPDPATPPAAEPDSRPRHLAPDFGTPPERTHAFPRYRLRDRPTQPATP